MEGSSRETIMHYMKCFSDASAEWNAKVDRDEENNTEKIKVRAVRILDLSGQIRSEFTNKEAISIEIDIDIVQWVSNLKVGFELQSEYGDIVFTSFHNDNENILRQETFKSGIHCFRAVIPPFLLNSNIYYISPCAGIHKKRWIFKKEKVVKFSVEFQINNLEYLVNKRPGIIGPFLEWKVSQFNTKVG